MKSFFNFFTCVVQQEVRSVDADVTGHVNAHGVSGRRHQMSLPTAARRACADLDSFGESCVIDDDTPGAGSGFGGEEGGIEGRREGGKGGGGG